MNCLNQSVKESLNLDFNVSELSNSLAALLVATEHHVLGHGIDCALEVSPEEEAKCTILEEDYGGLLGAFLHEVVAAVLASIARSEVRVIAFLVEAEEHLLQDVELLVAYSFRVSEFLKEAKQGRGRVIMFVLKSEKVAVDALDELAHYLFEELVHVVGAIFDQ